VPDRGRRSAIYFSVRANAHALTAGAGAASVARRLRLASLLHDDVVIDVGAWDGRAGATGSWEVRFRVPPEGAGPFEFQTPRARGRAAGSNFYMTAKVSGSPGLGHALIHSPTTIAWRPTFEPFKREMPSAYPWMHFESIDLVNEDKQVVSRMVRDDERDAVLPALVSDQNSRKLVIGSANYALVLGSRIGATVSMDAMHSRALSARVARGQASPVLGPGALAIMFPVVDDLTWDEIDEARRIRGMVSLRAILAEVEHEAWAAAEAGQSLGAAIVAEYGAALHREAARLAPSFKGTAASIALGAGLSLVTGPLPLAVGLGVGAAQAVGSAVLSKYQHDHSWIAAADRLRKVRRDATARCARRSSEAPTTTVGTR
jgi:hypothetical protein